MLVKYLKIFSILLLFYTTPLYSKNNYNKKFNSKNLSDYFSAITAYDNKKNKDALKFFNSSKLLINKHDPYLNRYIFSLIRDGKIKQSINYLNLNKDKKNTNFFEAYLLLSLENIQNKDFKKANKILKKLDNFEEKEIDMLSLIVYETLKSYIYLFKNKKILPKNQDFGDLSSITQAFQSCYLNEKKTTGYFLNLVDNKETTYSRYKFFYINYLLSQNKIENINDIVNKIDILNSSLLIYQTNIWVKNNQFKNISDIFSCENEKNLLSEFFFIIGNLYSNQNNYEKSNFYLNLSNYLNPKFKFNLTLIAENYYNEDDYAESKKILLKFNKNDGIYNWYQIKKRAKIIYQSDGEEESISYIISKFNTIKNPSIRIVYDMANILKNFKKFETAIGYYNEVISKTKKFDISYAELLYRRGSCYERIREYNKSDQDLLKSLEIKPNDAYVLNYLAYSWLERNYKIEVAIEMLERAHKEEKNDPYILDSIGWAYYLIGDFIKAEKFLTQAIKLMPDDPIVNDHYGDILWMMDRKIQARYYWKSVLAIEDADEDMKKNINDKLLIGLIKT